MILKPGYYRFFVDDRTLETKALELRGFFSSGFLPVRIEPDYCLRGLHYVVQYGDNRPTDNGHLIRDMCLLWHAPERRFDLCLKAPVCPITADELAVIDVAHRVVYQASANLRTVALNVDDLARAVRKLPNASPPIES